MIPVLANVITADMGLIPGLAFVGPAMGLPLSVLAAFIERPFYSRGGVPAHAIWYSLQANLVSLIAGFVLLLVFGCLASAVCLGASDTAFFVAWPLLAVCLSSVIERAYIARRMGSGGVSWGWAAAGNVLSAAVCVGTLVAVGWLRTNRPGLRLLVQPYAPALNILALAGSCAVFGLAFFVNCRRGRSIPAATQVSAAGPLLTPHSDGNAGPNPTH
jgi:hypothetical protein